ncbi:MAG: zinc ribbon domain-containing protein [Nocardioides sp.]|uniref:zinc ribbon domain-containing protein n=1 Tax=Nocardioides sp. TaxID=35761 RepID=UPI003D6A4548
MKLLDVQELDSRALQLRHRRGHLPQTAVVEELQAAKKRADDAVRDARVVRDDLERVQKKADADVESVKTRRRRDQERMDSGAISSAKDLERMQHELVTLDRRISVLEDEELEVMEQLEAAQTTVTRLETEIAEIDEKLGVALESRDVETAKLDSELASLAAERVPALEGIPDDLLSVYTRLSDKLGVGAAELRARRCGGCNLQLDPAEISRIRGLAADEVVRCEECSRILVRTAESGL